MKTASELARERYENAAAAAVVAAVMEGLAWVACTRGVLSLAPDDPRVTMAREHWRATVRIREQCDVALVSATADVDAAPPHDEVPHG